MVHFQAWKRQDSRSSARPCQHHPLLAFVIFQQQPWWAVFIPSDSVPPHVPTSSLFLHSYFLGSPRKLTSSTQILTSGSALRDLKLSESHRPGSPRGPAPVRAVLSLLFPRVLTDMFMYRASVVLGCCSDTCKRPSKAPSKT